MQEPNTKHPKHQPKPPPAERPYDPLPTQDPPPSDPNPPPSPDRESPDKRWTP